MANDNHNKVKIKPVGGKDSDGIWVYPIDAKEIVEQGTHVYVNSKSKQVSKNEEVSKDDEQVSDDINIEKINSMNTKELEQLLKDNSLDIQGFEQMNLKTKREAVVSLLENLNQDSDEDSEDGDL